MILYLIYQVLPRKFVFPSTDVYSPIYVYHFNISAMATDIVRWVMMNASVISGIPWDKNDFRPPDHCLSIHSAYILYHKHFGTGI